jgi:predicted nuclease of predicted toxin-antitoxin system
MRFLLDEGLPVQLLDPLALARKHQFDHVDHLKWKGKPDDRLFADAADRGFDAIVTLDVDQLSDPELCRALRQSGLHHVSLRQGRAVRQGAKGTARVIALLVAAMPYVIDDLETAGGQRIAEVQLLGSGKRHGTFDPTRERARYPYWR